MNIDPSATSGPLLLYREASRISNALRDFCEEMRPQLSSMEEEDLSDCATRYTDALIQLGQLSDQITELNRSDLSSQDRIEQEALRQSIRSDLNGVAEMEQPLRAALESKRDEFQTFLVQIQKKRKLSAYLKVPLIGQDRNHYDRRD